MRLKISRTSQFDRDIKGLKKRHVNTAPLREVIRLVAENSPEFLAELRRRHRMHRLTGAWAGSNECHVANAGDWLVIWISNDTVATFQRTGSHDELFQ